MFNTPEKFNASNSSENDLETSEYEELDLYSLEGLKTLLSETEKLYADSAEVAAVIDEVGADMDDGISGLGVMQKMQSNLDRMQELIEQCQNDILPFRDDIPDDLFAEIESIYGEMTTLSDYLFDRYNRLATEIEEPEEGNYEPVGRVSKKMDISSGDEDRGQSIKINVKTAEAVQKILSEDSAFIREDMPDHEQLVVGEVEDFDPINEVIEVETELAPDEIEKMVNSEVRNIEAETLDRFERYFDDGYTSSFEYLRDMPVLAVMELADDTNVRKLVIEQGMKYETFTKWVDKIPAMLEGLKEDDDINDDITFGELFTRSLLKEKGF